MEKNKLLIITPTYNEIENIENFLIEISKTGIDILVIDDNSPDGTYDIVKKFQKNSQKIHLIHRDSKQGLGSAYREGFSWFLENDFTHCIEMDVDFSHRIEDLNNMVNKINNFDLIIGSRYIKGGGSSGWDYKRKKLSLFANKFAKLILNSGINDMTSGFRIFSKNALIKIDFKSLKTNGYGFQIETAFLAKKNNLTVKEVPIIFEERRLGESKMSYSIVLEAVFLLFKLCLANLTNRSQNS